MLGIYIHVPFCLKRCNYCDFCSSVASSGRISEYAAAIVRNIRAYAGKGLKADTVYLGGGTPSLLSPEDMRVILAAVKESFDISTNAEITTEANPGTVTLEKLSAYREAGINRISFGVQSCKDNELYKLGRLHNFYQSQEAVAIAKASGINNISCDLMIGIPEQTPQTLSESVEALCALDIQHISAYMLKIEEGTPFDCPEIRNSLPDDDTVSDMYLMTVEMLSQRGFEQYEISNFSKPGFESRHNLKYWTGEPYIGFGPSAHSYFTGRRFYVPDDIDGFISSAVQKINIEDSSPDLLAEYIMLGLRLRKGVSLAEASSLGGNADSLVRAAKPFERAKLLTVSGDNIALTRAGFLVSNGIIAKLLDSQI